MAKFYFFMQHNPTTEQAVAAQGQGAQAIIAMAPRPDPEKGGQPTEGVEYLGNTRLLNVPDDPALAREWFIARAAEVVSAGGGVEPGDIVHCMGQQQLVNAVNALCRRAGAVLVESVTKRDSVERQKPDGTVEKVAVFVFQGYRSMYEF